MEERCEVVTSSTMTMIREEIKDLLSKYEGSVIKIDPKAMAEKAVDMMERLDPLYELVKDLTDKEYQQLLQTIRLIVGMVKHSRDENNADGDKESTT